MARQRVGMVPHTDHEHAQHLYRAAVIVSRDASDLEERGRYGRAVLGTLAQAAGHARLVDVGGVVIWGKDDKAVGAMMMRQQAAVAIVVLRSKPRKDSMVMHSAQRLAAQGVRVEVYTIPAKAKKVQAIDVGIGREVAEVKDLRRPPQQQDAPSIPRRAVEARTHSAPSVPRDPVAPAEHTAPSTPRVRVRSTSSPAPAMDPAEG